MKITSRGRVWHPGTITKSCGFSFGPGGTIQHKEQVNITNAHWCSRGYILDGSNTLIIKHPREEYGLYIGEGITDLVITHWWIEGLGEFSWRNFYHFIKRMYKFWRTK